MAAGFPHERQAQTSRLEADDPFAEQLRLSSVHTRLVPMRQIGVGYSIDPASAGWFVLPASRGFAGYGLGRALRLLLDVTQGLSALHATSAVNGEPFAHGEFAPLHFRVDSLGVCRLVPLTTRHYVSEYVPAPRAALGFLSPERLIAEKVGVRADVFSVGVLLWEALAGRRLTELHSSEAILKCFLNQSLRVPPLPPQLAWATPLKAQAERALSVNQQRRFADCAELSATILSVAHDHLASHSEIVAFFSAMAKPSPGSPPPMSSSPPSSIPSSHERLIAARGTTLRMPSRVLTPPSTRAPLLRSPPRATPLPSLPRPTLPFSVRRSTPPAVPQTLPEIMSQLQIELEQVEVPSAPSRPLPVVELQQALAPTVDVTQSPILLEVAQDPCSSAAPRSSRRRWMAVSLLIGAILGVGIVAHRRARSAAASVRAPSSHSASSPIAQLVASSQTCAPMSCSENRGSASADSPTVEDGAKKDPEATPAATAPNVGRPSEPLAPRSFGRAAAPTRTGRDYGI